MIISLFLFGNGVHMEKVTFYQCVPSSNTPGKR
jgi:hypothetical protein